MFVFKKVFYPLVKRLHTTHLHHTLENIIILSLYFVNYIFLFFKKKLYFILKLRN